MNYRFKTKPYAHQLTALKRSWNKEVFAYFMEMGTGKSKVLIDNVSMLYDKGKINGLLLVAPKGVYKNWYDSEIPTHMVEHIDKKMVLWQANITKSQQRQLNTLFETGEDLHILIMNVDAFSTSKGVEFAAKFLRCHRTLMAIDESTTIKNPDAKRSKNICSLGRHAAYRRILTGSPVTKSPLDLYKQCEFLDEGLLDFTSYFAFRTRYAQLTTMRLPTHSVQVVTGYKNLGELSEKITTFSERILKEDCLDLPAYTYQKRIIQLSPEQKKLYDQMSKVALAQMEGKLMTTSTALVQLMRLQQITCGHFKADDGTLKIIKNERISTLMDIIEEVEGKAIIWAHWRHDIASIVKAIEKTYPGSVMTYYGSTSTADRQKAIKEIQDPESKVRFLVGTPQTGGYGITLTEANVMIYYSNGYDLEKRTQSEARINRIGQTRKMTYIDIIAEKTVDERIVKALRKKVNIASEVMGEELKAWI
jgi:SNF2 family DNA or RNA helicase|tara:strand:- start:587 stop:2017 length:1431 start_codon:yes stop_codon:yes gene_type:complete